VSPLIEYVDGGAGRNYFLVGSYPSWQNSMFRQSRFRIGDQGGHVLGQALTDVGEMQFEPVLRWIADTDADVVLYCVPRSNGPLFIKRAKQMGLLGRLTFAWIGFNETHHAVLSSEERERVVTCSSFVMSDRTTGVREFVERVQRVHGADFPVTYYAHNHSSAVAALGEAWIQAGEASGYAAIATLPGLSFNGANGSMTINAASHHSTLNLVIAKGGEKELEVVKRLGSVGAAAGCTV
jgi:ABC-type branched-subunit amino acid transport system substrate-binding protein